MTSIERRYTSVPVEARTRGDKRLLGGYAATFLRYSSNLGGFVEQVGPTAFNHSRADGWPDVLARYNHDDNMLLGTTGGGTLRLSLDDTGLDYEVDPPEARADVYELVARGDVRKSSFAFRVLPDGDEWSVTDQNFPLRTLTNVQLVDVAPVNMPAYTTTTVGALRSLAEFMHAELEDVEAAAKADELRKFFTRTDRPGPPTPKTFGPQALAILMGREKDPYST